MGEIPMVPWESSSHRMKKFKMPHMPDMPHMPYMPDMPKMPHKPHMPHSPKHRRPHHHHHHRMKEPYLHEHLMEMMGQYVEVGTLCKTIKGKLKEVLPDHIMIEHDHRHYHVRLKGICFVAPMMDP